MRLIIVATLLSLSVSAAHAYCSEPSAPSCASGYGSFDDEDEFDRCRRDMESFRSDVEDFLSCTQREIDDLSRKTSSATDDYNSAVSSFNDRTR